MIEPVFQAVKGRAPKESGMSEVAILLIPPPKPPLESSSQDIWRVCRFVDNKLEEIVTSHIAIEQGCYSVHKPLDKPNIPYHHVGAYGRITYDTDGVLIAGKTPRSRLIPESTEGLTKIRIRFNTGYLKDPDESPWRLLIDREDGVHELLIDSFLLIGRCHTTKDPVQVDGKWVFKWHITCWGKIVFVHSYSYVEIISHE